MLLGQDVRKYRRKELRDQIGIVPQKAVLFAGTVRENMQWGKKDATDEEIWEALKPHRQKNSSVRKKEVWMRISNREDAIFPAVRGRDLRSQGHW